MSEIYKGRWDTFSACVPPTLKTKTMWRECGLRVRETAEPSAYFRDGSGKLNPLYVDSDCVPIKQRKSRVGFYEKLAAQGWKFCVELETLREQYEYVGNRQMYRAEVWNEIDGRRAAAHGFTAAGAIRKALSRAMAEE